jgi:thiosulfate/3-mercaptopyruvate sulfurtransferase
MSTTQDQTLRARHLVSAVQLSDELASSRPPVLLDVRFAPNRPDDGRAEYLKGHLSGALYVDLPRDLSSEPVPSAHTGRRPLPRLSDLQATLRRLGLNSPDQPVVLYDDRKGQSAARGWWVLRWAGLTDVRLLDGALPAWVNAGLPLVTEVSEPAPGAIELPGNGLRLIDADAASALARRGVLVDARDEASYTGTSRAADELRSGHIPGAINLPTADNLADDGTFLEPDVLRRRFEQAGVVPNAEIGIYCGGGVAATHELVALASIGIDAALFVGSWSAWSDDLDRPIAVGIEPGVFPS